MYTCDKLSSLTARGFRVDSIHTFGLIPQRVFPQTKHFVGLLVGVIFNEGGALIVGIIVGIVGVVIDIVVCPEHK
jgi:hypothetical protein